MTEEREGDAYTVGALLAVEGHAVTFCHPHGGAHHPCVGLSAVGRCPLLTEPVDVVVDVRIDGGPPTAREMGATCALRHPTPLLIAGSAPDASALAEGALFACPPDAVTAACAGLDDGRRA
ncbi:hypothetical protein ACSNOI_01300 [Actinomadura kijaniata]|uniref:hypothetical protein n=1 Tax=Actinomadura kijaniata TaxID=46161 RepID=UPI003F1E1460